MAATREIDVRFLSPSTPAVELAGCLHEPDGVQGSLPGVVLMHPQPLVDDMNDPLTVRVARDLAAAGMAALRFNFRGVPPSGGEITDGRLEPLDAAGAVAWLLARPEIDGARLALVGHAFGAWVALDYAAVDERVGTIVAVSPPHFRLTPGFAATLERPKLIVIGDDDEVSPRFKVEHWLSGVPGPRGLSVIPDAQHLMRGREAAAAAIIVNYLARWAGIR
jgi:alpha/beta superfamily hydrolase